MKNNSILLRASFLSVSLMLLLVIAGCSQQPPSESNDASTQLDVSNGNVKVTAGNTDVAVQSGTVGISTDLKQVFASGVDYTCSVKVNNIAETVYVGKEKMRVDVVYEGKESHTIMLGTNVYTWTAEQCYKISTAGQTTPDSPASTAQTPQDLQTNAVDVRCTPGAPSSVFVPPANCQDLNALLQQLQQTTPQFPTGAKVPESVIE